jgi:thiol-activated cytolysin
MVRVLGLGVTAMLLAACVDGAVGSAETTKTGGTTATGAGAGGGGATTTEPGTGGAACDPSGLRDLINGVPSAKVADAVPEHVDPNEPVESKNEVEDGQVMHCTYTTMTGIKQFETMVAMDANGDALWPGSVVQTKTLPVGLLAPIALPRRPLTITMTNALSGADEVSYSRTIDQPSLATVNDAIGEILNSKKISFAAKSVYSGQQVYSFDQAAVAVDLAVSWANGAVAATFDGDWQTRKTRFVLKFTQNFYTVSSAPPATPDALFDACVTPEDAAAYIQADNPPGYISTVTYGRTLYMKIESNLKSSDVEASLAGQYKGGVVDVSASVTTGFKDVLANSNVEIFALGGDPKDVAALQATMADETFADKRAEALADYLQKGATFSVDRPVVPIGYTVRHLRDNSVMRIASPYDYKVPNCYAKADQFELDLEKVHVWDDGDSGLKGAGEITLNVFFRRSSDDVKGECGPANPGGCGTLMLANFYTHSNSGDDVPITNSNSVVFAAPQSDGETITITLIGKEDDNDKQVVVSNVNQFVITGNGSGSWTHLGKRSMRGAADNLDLELFYSLNKL